MRETGQGRQREARNSRYVYGATAEDFVRELNDFDEASVEEGRKLKKAKSRTRGMDLPYVIFLGAALAVCAFTLINYVRLQSGITDSIDKAAAAESRYVSLKIGNDEEYDRIVNSVDLDEVKRIAIEQLGMHYATEGQIVTYTNEMKDYVRLYSDVAE